MSVLTPKCTISSLVRNRQKSMYYLRTSVFLILVREAENRSYRYSSFVERRSMQASVGRHNFHVLPQTQPIYLMRKSFKSSFQLCHDSRLQKILTDASKADRQCSIAFHSPAPTCFKKQFNIPLQSSVYTTQLTAIYLALRYTITLDLRNSHIPMISDSQMAIQNITKPLFKRQVTPLILFIRDLLQYLLHFYNCKTNFI